MKGILALANGAVFHGESIGAPGLRVGELCFNTAMTGYQEILSDPSYARQIVTLTYPHIGNYGANDEDMESARVYAEGLIIRQLPKVHSNWRAQEGLSEFLQRRQVVALAGVDTRQITRILRDQGAQNSALYAGDDGDPEQVLQAAREFSGLLGADLAREVSTRTPYDWNCSGPYRVAAYDFGVKHNILRMLAERGCQVRVFPAESPLEELLAFDPHGIFLSNGPGDPSPMGYARTAIEGVLAKRIPVFGICLGHQLLCLAMGAEVEKMKFGHHGANHPVKHLSSGKVAITSQNHGFAVNGDTLPETLTATHVSLFDGSLQGVEHVSLPAFSFQGHPEASPGPQDVAPLFDRFIDLMRTSD